MQYKYLWARLQVRLKAQWIACKLISDRKSVQYGIRFSYPLFISVVLIGVYLTNPFILAAAAFIAFLGTFLPIHPFDYVYNYGVVRVLGANKIPGRGSELQVNSIVTLIFTLLVSGLIVFRIPINYFFLAFIYLLSSVFILGTFLLKKESNP
jgi:hypothetical protein